MFQKIVKELLTDQIWGLEDLIKPEKEEDFIIQGSGLRFNRSKIKRIFRTYAEEQGLKINFKFNLPFSGKYRFTLSGPSHKITELKQKLNSLFED